MVWEVPYFPGYYFPLEDVSPEVLIRGNLTKHSPGRGDATLATVPVGDRVAVDAAQEFVSSPIEALSGDVRFESDAMDAWFEEGEEIFVHPRDPGVRVEILAGSRHVRIEVGGVTVADSVRPRLLFETGLPGPAAGKSEDHRAGYRSCLLVPGRPRQPPGCGIT